MAGESHRGPTPPPPGKQGRGRSGVRQTATEAHAREVVEVTAGRDALEAAPASREQRLAAFQGPAMLVVRSWLERRPVDAPQAPATLVAFPRQWATMRGRYCRFVAPGAGVYGLVRARPTF
jgi:hypothetical protein